MKRNVGKPERNFAVKFKRDSKTYFVFARNHKAAVYKAAGLSNSRDPMTKAWFDYEYCRLSGLI